MKVFQRPRGDDGVSLVMALVFLFVVSIFITVALEKSQSTSMSGATLRQRGDLQYALDGGIERAMRLLQEDMAATSDPRLCESPSPDDQELTAERDGAGLVLNGQTVTFRCRGLAGVAAKDSDTDYSNYALVLTDSGSDALETQSAVSNDLVVSGAVYLAGDVTNSALGKPIAVEAGDVVQSSTTCVQADLDAVTQLTVQPDQHKSCTAQTVAQAQPTVTLPVNTLGSQDRQSTFVDYPLPVATGNGNGAGNGNGNGNGSPECRVFFPGRYAGSPELLSGNGTVNWFLGGLYYFDFPTGDPQWSISNQQSVVVGTPQPDDEGASVPSGCPNPASISSGLAALVPPRLGLPAVDLALAAKGGTFVFGGPSRIVVNGSLRMASPEPWAPGQQPVNIVAARPADSGYTTWSGGSALLLENSGATSAVVLNAKLLAPDSDASLFASLPNVATIRGGAILRRLQLGASAAAQDIAIQASGSVPSPPDPYRTVRVTSADSGGSTGINVAVVTVSNFPPYTVQPLSWRSE